MALSPEAEKPGTSGEAVDDVQVLMEKEPGENDTAEQKDSGGLMVSNGSPLLLPPLVYEY